MKLCCGSTYTTTLYSVFESGSYRVTPSVGDLISSIKFAASSGFGALELEALTSQHLKTTFAIQNLKEIKKASEDARVRIPQVSFPFISRSFPQQEP